MHLPAQGCTIPGHGQPTGEGHFLLPRCATVFWKGGLPQKPWTVVAQCALTLTGLALGWVPSGLFWGRMEVKEPHLWLWA